MQSRSQTFARTPLFLLGMLLWLSACSEQDTSIIRPDYPDLYDRFTTRQIIAAEDLPVTPTAIRFFPGTSQFLVLGKTGEVFHFTLQDTGALLLGKFTVPDVAPAPEEIGLTGVTFDPDFTRNRYLYMAYTTGDNRRNRVIRLTWFGNYDTIVRSIRTIIQVDRIFPDKAEHGIYDLCFGADGYLYTAMGDAFQPETAQDPGLLLGKLLRLDPGRGDDGGYRIPPDNPYLDQEGTRPEIAAFGLRTPFRLLPWEDKIYIANVGQNRYEEIHVYTLGKRNFGWPYCEGHCDGSGYDNPVFLISHADPIYQTQDPVQSSNNRLSISLGVAYAPRADDPYNGLLNNRLLINDVFQGFVRAAALQPSGALRDDQHIFHLEFITSMDIGPDGAIYGVTIFGSQVFRVQLKPD